MAVTQVILVLFCGEIWNSLSTVIPQNISISKRNAHTSSRSPTEDKAPLYQLQATGLSLHRSGRALNAPPPAPSPKANVEPSDGGWIAAVIIGIILISMILAIIIILVWKCCKKPVLIDSTWAGRSPFADGDMPEVLVDSDQATKRSSVLFMLPWKSKQDTHLEHNPISSEKPPVSTTSNETSQLPPPAEDCSVATTSGSPTDPAPAPTSEADNCAPVSCTPPAPSPGSSDLPPPLDWLREPAEDLSANLSKNQEFHLETEEQLPPPPEPFIQEIHELLPQPQDPL